MESRLKEYRVFGPPGTGKTHYLVENIRGAVKVFGGGNIIVSSFTKAAATELVSRIGSEGVEVPERQVGTLHSHGYRSIGAESAGEVAESPKWVAAWNAEFGNYYRLTVDIDAEDGTFDSSGDDIITQYHNYRQRMIERSRWSKTVQVFGEKWENWKLKNYLIDYTDMIEIPLKTIDVAVGTPAVGIFDEVQDFTPLELALIRKWGSKMQHIILAGDDDQSIYSFKGATPEAFLNPPIPDDFKRVLRKSYRMPQAIQAFSQNWIKQIKNREPKEFKPRDEEGEIRLLLNSSIREPEMAIRDAQQYLQKGKTIMFLVSCSYMLDKIKLILRREGIPFHNPYRRRRIDWNPLYFYEDKTSAAQRLLAFLKPSMDIFLEESRSWTWAEIAKFSEILKADNVFQRGKKTLVRAHKKDNSVPSVQELLNIFTPCALERLFDSDIDWFMDNLLDVHKQKFNYPIGVLKKKGVEALTETPKIIISTIHAVKGGEADVVYLFPDLSYQGYLEYSHHLSRDSVIRQYYVGMTRARESLVICSPATPYYVDFSAFVPRGGGKSVTVV